MKKIGKYPLDSSAIIYMALLQDGISNVFRLSANLQDAIKPEILQKTVNNITPRFPTMVAGISSGVMEYFAVSVETPPKVKQEIKALLYMPKKEIKKCAIRILYKENMIAVEFFHAITDGRGASIFFKSLIAEYIRLAYGVACSDKDGIILPNSPINEEELSDSFIEYRGKKRQPYFHSSSYRFKRVKKRSEVSVVTGIYDTRSILRKAHEYGVTLTAFLSAVMLESVMELQLRIKKPRQRTKPVHLMVPIDLRGQFPSETLRNFALQAYLSLYPNDVDVPFENLINSVKGQLQRQFDVDPLSAIITETARLQHDLQFVPILIKTWATRFVLNFVEENTSALFFSNLGVLKLPNQLKPYVKGVDFVLTPRISSPYNCGVISLEDRLHINLTKCGEGAGLERLFFEKLHRHGCIPEMLVDGKPVSMAEFLGWSNLFKE